MKTFIRAAILEWYFLPIGRIKNFKNYENFSALWVGHYFNNDNENKMSSPLLSSINQNKISIMEFCFDQSIIKYYHTHYANTFNSISTPYRVYDFVSIPNTGLLLVLQKEKLYPKQIKLSNSGFKNISSPSFKKLCSEILRYKKKENN